MSLGAWVRRYAIRETCPRCAGVKRPRRQADSIVQHSMLCPICRQVWIYRVDIERAVALRVPRWHYSRSQPFVNLNQQKEQPDGEQKEPQAES